jgi:hypothetical protein
MIIQMIAAGGMPVLTDGQREAKATSSKVYLQPGTTNDPIRVVDDDAPALR